MFKVWGFGFRASNSEHVVLAQRKILKVWQQRFMWDVHAGCNYSDVTTPTRPSINTCPLQEIFKSALRVQGPDALGLDKACRMTGLLGHLSTTL